MRSVIIVFAKAPIVGNVKTRLVPPLLACEAACLHSAFVQDTIERFNRIPNSQIELHTDTDTDAWAGLSVSCKLQIRGDLGLRMFHALNAALESGAELAAVLGSDSPTLPEAHVHALLECKSDLALGPSEDGGYYAIVARRVHRDMFREVAWSQPTALAQTVAAAEACGLTTSLGPLWFDVDEPADLRRLLRAPGLPKHTSAWLGDARKDLIDAL